MIRFLKALFCRKPADHQPPRPPEPQTTSGDQNRDTPPRCNVPGQSSEPMDIDDVPLECGPHHDAVFDYLIEHTRGQDVPRLVMVLAGCALSYSPAKDHSSHARHATPVHMSMLLTLGSNVNGHMIALGLAYMYPRIAESTLAHNDPAYWARLREHCSKKVEEAIKDLLDYASTLGGRNCLPPPPPSSENPDEFDVCPR